MRRTLKNLARDAWAFLVDSDERQERIPPLSYLGAAITVFALFLAMSVGAAYGF